MATDLTSKKQNFVSRLQAAVNANTDAINALVALYSEAQLSGFVPAAGAAPGPAAIVDADLNEPAANGARAPFPYLSAADLAAVVGSLAAVKADLDQQGHTANFLKMRP